MMLPCAERRYICDSTSVGPSPRARARDRRADGLVDRDRVAAVDRDARHAERLRLDRQVLAAARGSRPPARCACGRCSRCSPSRRRSAASTARRCSATPRTRPASRRRRRRSRGRPGPACGSAPPRPHRSRAGCPAATIPDVPRKPFDDVGEVHRAADALAEAVLAAVDLGHHRLRVGAARDRVAVAAVGREELVVGAERRDRPDDRRLGAVGEMRVAADHAGVLDERALHALLELADAQHLRRTSRRAGRGRAPRLRSAALTRSSSRAELGGGRLVRPPEDHVDRVVAQLLGEHLDAPRARRSRGRWQAST